MTTPLWPAELVPEPDDDRDELEDQISAMVSDTRLVETSIVHTDAAPGTMDRFGAWAFTKVSEPGDSYPVIRFKVAGIARPQGSKRAYVNKQSGKIVMREMSEQLPNWRAAIAKAASDVMGDHALLEGPLKLSVTFVFPRPKSHLLASGRPKASAPAAPVGRNLGDLSKLIRGLEDAMTGVVFKDDAQFTTFDGVGKRWGIAAATYVTVQPDPVEA